MTIESDAQLIFVTEVLDKFSRSKLSKVYRLLGERKKKFRCTSYAGRQADLKTN